MSIRFLAIAATISLVQSAAAADINVLSAGGIRPALDELLPQFERSSGHKVVIKYVGGPVVKSEIDAGSAFDVVISTTSSIDGLIKAGKIAAATRADVARAGVGVGVRAGAPRPDIGSVDAFKRALLNAKSVAFAKDGAAGQHFQQVLERLGISKEMEPKLIRTTAGDTTRGAGALVSKGEAEMNVAAIATIPVPGVVLIGPLPAELQSYIHFAAGVSTGAKEPKAGAALIGFLTAPAAAPAMKAKGIEPAPGR